MDLKIIVMSGQVLNKMSTDKTADARDKNFFHEFSFIRAKVI